MELQYRSRRRTMSTCLRFLKKPKTGGVLSTLRFLLLLLLVRFLLLLVLPSALARSLSPPQHIKSIVCRGADFGGISLDDSLPTFLRGSSRRFSWCLEI